MDRRMQPANFWRVDYRLMSCAPALMSRSNVKVLPLHLEEVQKLASLQSRMTNTCYWHVRCIPRGSLRFLLQSC